MADKADAKPSGPAFVVLRQREDGTWEFLGGGATKARSARARGPHAGDPRRHARDGEDHGGLCGSAQERVASRTGLVGSKSLTLTWASARARLEREACRVRRVQLATATNQRPSWST